MKSIFTALTAMLLSFNALCCMISIELDPDWACNDLEICWDDGGEICQTIVPGDIFNVPNGVHLTFQTASCSATTFFTIFNEEGEYLESVDITGPNLAFSWTTDCEALPVELTSFYGRSVQNGIQLNWTFEYQENLSYIEVYRNGYVIDVLNIYDDTELNFMYLDRAPEIGTDYYRLRFVDYDNSFSYSPVIAIDYSNESVSMISNANNVFLFTVSSEHQFDYNVKVYSLNGQILHEQKWQGYKYDELVLHLDHPGLFIVTFENSYTSFAFKGIAK